MTYEIYHQTAFHYQGLVTFSHNIARLRPKESVTQHVVDFQMEVTPLAYETSDFTDMFGNATSHLLIREAHRSLSVVGRSHVSIDEQEVLRRVECFEALTLTCEEVASALTRFDPDAIEAKLFLFDSKRIPKASDAIRGYARRSFEPHRPIAEAIKEFMGRIYDDFDFVAGFSDITTPIEEIFEAKKGVCQDFAQFAIAALRSLGLSARYVSGYIETVPPLGGEKLFGSDASHAWVGVYIPQYGWAAFDPTNNLLASTQHIVLGSGRDYDDVAPLRGVVLSSGQSKLSIEVDVRRNV